MSQTEALREEISWMHHKIASLRLERDAALQSAKDAHALAYEECTTVANRMAGGERIAAALRARIEALLEQKP